MTSERGMGMRGLSCLLIMLAGLLAAAPTLAHHLLLDVFEEVESRCAPAGMVPIVRMGACTNWRLSWFARPGTEGAHAAR
jgi:hypothetical protein